MADISKIKLPNGNTYDLKDIIARQAHQPDPIATKTYTDVIATTNDANGGGFFYLKVRGDTYNSYWHVKTRVKATVPGQHLYFTDTTFDIFGYANTYSWYACLNRIKNTSYRPIHYNSYFRVSETGYNNGCGAWIGFSLMYSSNPTNTSYKREITVELLEYENCTVELQDSLITPTNIPERAAHTNYYSSTNTSYDNFDASSYGLRQSGDANTTSITNLYFGNGNYVAKNAVYRYQLLFQVDDNTLTPLNSDNNVVGTTKTMLTNQEFDPFGRIFYFYSSGTVAVNGGIGGGAIYWAFNGIDLRYTFNCGTTLTAHNPVYLVVTPTTNGKCKLASTTPWAQTLPATNDGKWYILLGRAYSSYQLTLYPYHPVYYNNGTVVRQISANDILGNATTVNGHTVATDVPANAVFTDTTYESKTAVANGTDVSLVTTGEKAAWNAKTSNTGTITGIKMNGVSKGTSGVVDLGTVITSHQDISGKLNTSLKGAANGLAELDANGKVPSTQLPSYVDDVLEYTAKANFPTTGETGKIYVDKTTNLTYRWSGSAYVEISASLALGETSSTAYRGDRGKIAYDHSQSTHARTDATAVAASSTNGNIKINGTETTVYTHPGSGTNPHGTTKTDVGLGNVGNFKAVSTVASQGLTNTEKSNARTNIGAGTSSLTLGTTSSTAYRGDYGAAAYAHGVTNKGSAFTSGFYKITTNAEGHVTAATAVTKADITGLGIPAQDTDTTYTANTSKLVTTTVPNITSVGSAPTLGTAIPADDITAWNAGSTPTLGTAIPADDITAWTTNTPTAFTISGEKLVITPGAAASLSYTAKSIPNVTSVGSVPSLSYTAKSIPNVTSVGSAPTLGTAITVATGSLASNGSGGTVATGITAQ